jgi:hypothetical protein
VVLPRDTARPGGESEPRAGYHSSPAGYPPGLGEGPAVGGHSGWLATEPTSARLDMDQRSANE